MANRGAVCALGLGLAFWWPCVFETDFFTPARSAFDMQVPTLFLQYTFPAMLVALAAVLALAHPRLKRSGTVPALVVIGALGLAGYLMQAESGMASYNVFATLQLNGAQAGALAVAGSLASSCYLVFFLISWFHLSRCCPVVYLPVLVTCSYAGSELLQILLGFVPQGAQLVFRCACPLASALLIVPAALRQPQRGCGLEQAEASPLLASGILVFSLALICFGDLFKYAMGVAYAESAGFEHNAVTPLVSLVLMLVIAVFLYANRTRRYQGTIAMFVALALAYMAVLLVIVAFPGAHGRVTDRLFVALGHAFRVLVLVILCWGVSHHVMGKEPAACIYAIIAIGVPLALQNACASLLAASPADSSLFMQAAGIGLFAISLALMAFIVLVGRRDALLRERSAARTWHVDRCRPIAEQAGLTPKELEVASLIYRGYTLKRIAAQLDVSTSTIETHQRHIYRKAGVHSRQDFIDLVDARE